MQKVESLEEYYALINEAKQRCGSLKTNCTLFPDAMQRYIDQQNASTGTVVDIYSKFGEDGSTNAIRARNIYLQGLVNLARGDKAAAREQFSRSLELNPSSVWVKYFLNNSR